MRAFAVALAAVAYAGLLVVFSGEPTVVTDSGIFLSVGGRLLEGDHLYVDVIDNKDPLFYYLNAAAQAIGDWRAPFFLDIVWVALGAGSVALLLRSIGASRLVTVVGFLAFPVLVTWTWYRTGHSMLGALVLAPLVAWLWTRGSFAMAGIVLGISVLFKVNLVLVVASAPLALLLLRVPGGPVRRQLSRAVAGVVAALAVGAGFLALRGELSGYFDVLANNAEYSRTARYSGIFGHLKVATQDALDEPWHTLWFLEAMFFVGALLAAGWLWRRRTGLYRTATERSAMDVLAALCLSAAVTTVVTLAVTAVWYHHLQVLAYVGVLAAAFLVTLVQESQALPVRALAACAAIGVAVAMVWDTRTRSFFDASPAWSQSGYSETADLLERVADDDAPGLDEITFAHLGQNDERAVGAFLDDRFVLACPDIAQYQFSVDTSVLDCIRDETPRLVLVTPSFDPTDEAGVSPEWNGFVSDGKAFLRVHYDLAGRMDTEVGVIEVWAARASVARRGPVAQLVRAADS